MIITKLTMSAYLDPNIHDTLKPRRGTCKRKFIREEGRVSACVENLNKS